MKPLDKGTVLPVPADHGWRSREGFSIVVADRGAVRFDVPVGWQIGRGDDCDLELTDAPPPDDECSLKMSLLRVPVPADSAPPLVELLRSVAFSPNGPAITSSDEPVHETGGGAELAWVQARFCEDGREAITRTLIARGPGLHALFTLSLWADDEERIEPAWQELRRSLELGKAYDTSGRDPRRN